MAGLKYFPVVMIVAAISVYAVLFLEISQNQDIQSLETRNQQNSFLIQHLQLAQLPDQKINIMPKTEAHIPSEWNGTQVPVVSVYLSDSKIVPVHVWKSMQITALHNNDVVLISYASAVPDDARKAGIRTAAVQELETSELLLFRQRFMSWERRAIIERQNSERFLILKRFMEIEGREWVFFVDPEVALLMKVGLQSLDAGCDTMLDLDKHSSRQIWDSVLWSVWPGAAIINRRVLDDFSDFALGMFMPPSIDLLSRKQQQRPFVCDQTLWYLFAGAADPNLAALWAWNSSSVSLPRTRSWSLCDGAAVGFAHTRGYSVLPDGGLQLDPTAKSVRFPDQPRDDAALLLAQILERGKARGNASAPAAAASTDLPPTPSPPPPPPPSIQSSLKALPSLDSDTLIVVYMFFVNKRPKLPGYAWATMRVTAQHGNDVVLITSEAVQVPAEVLAAGVRVRAMEGLETPAQLRFREVYTTWDNKNRWELQNTERYFVLLRFMELEGLERVFFADSDVAMLTRVGQSAVPPGCDTMLSMQNNSAKMQWATWYWAAWAGTALLGRPVLADFTAFALALFEPAHIGVLRHKLCVRPYVCDMTFWYLFVGRADPSRARAWKFNAEAFPLPPARQEWRFCDSVAAGFGHVGGYKKGSNGTLKVLANVKSVHFQGSRKRDAFKLLEGFVRAKADQDRLLAANRP